MTQEQKEITDILKRCIMQTNSMCRNMLISLKEIGKRVEVDAVISVAYSPIRDTFFVYTSDNYSVYEIKKGIEAMNKPKIVLEYKSLDIDIVNNKGILEIEYGSEKTIKFNIENDIKAIALNSEIIKKGYENN